MRQLVEAVAASLEQEVPELSGCEFRLFDPMWRNPKRGKVVSVWAERRVPLEGQWTGSTQDAVELVIEYAEPSPEQATALDRDEDAELAATEVADAVHKWTLAHEAGFPPAWRMDWTETLYVPNQRELYTRYFRMALALVVTSQRPTQ